MVIPVQQHNLSLAQRQEHRVKQFGDLGEHKERHRNHDRRHAMPVLGADEIVNAHAPQLGDAIGNHEDHPSGTRERQSAVPEHQQVAEAKRLALLHEAHQQPDHDHVAQRTAHHQHPDADHQHSHKKKSEGSECIAVSRSVATRESLTSCRASELRSSDKRSSARSCPHSKLTTTGCSLLTQPNPPRALPNDNTRASTLRLAKVEGDVLFAVQLRG